MSSKPDHPIDQPILSQDRPGIGGAAANSDRLFTRGFVLICADTLAFFGSFYLLVPVIPLWVLAIGGNEADVGLAAGAFSFTAVLVRPFIGREADRRGRRLFVLLGALVFLASALLYQLTTSVPLLILLRLFHGCGIACFTTASSTIVADITPPRRRGEAMGYFGISNTLALAIGPGIATVLLAFIPLSSMFLVSAAIAALAVLIAAVLPGEGRSTAHTAPAASLISRPALFPAAVMACLTASYGAVFTFIPLLVPARNMDLSSTGLFFVVYAGFLLASRAFSGIVSDRWGRAAAIVPGMLAAGIAMALVGLSFAVPTLVAAAALYGLAFGAVHPSLMAFVVDRVLPRERSAAMGTFTASFDLGIGVGAIIWGAILSYVDYTAVFMLAGLVCLVGLGIFVQGSQRASRSPASRTL